MSVTYLDEETKVSKGLTWLEPEAEPEPELEERFQVPDLSLGFIEQPRIVSGKAERSGMLKPASMQERIAQANQFADVDDYKRNEKELVRNLQLKIDRGEPVDPDIVARYSHLLELPEAPKVPKEKVQKGLYKGIPYMEEVDTPMVQPAGEVDTRPPIPVPELDISAEEPMPTPSEKPLTSPLTAALQVARLPIESMSLAVTDKVMGMLRGAIESPKETVRVIKNAVLHTAWELFPETMASYKEGNADPVLEQNKVQQTMGKMIMVQDAIKNIHKETIDELRKVGGLPTTAIETISEAIMDTALTLGIARVTGGGELPVASIKDIKGEIKTTVDSASRFATLVAATTPGTLEERATAGAHAAAFVMSPVTVAGFNNAWVRGAILTGEYFGMDVISDGYANAVKEAKELATQDGRPEAWAMYLTQTVTPLVVSELAFGIMGAANKGNKAAKELVKKMPLDVRKVAETKPIGDIPESFQFDVNLGKQVEPVAEPQKTAKPPVLPPTAAEITPETVLETVKTTEPIPSQPPAEIGAEMPTEVGGKPLELPDWIKVGQQAMMGTDLTTKPFRSMKELSNAIEPFQDKGEWKVVRETAYDENGNPYKAYTGVIFKPESTLPPPARVEIKQPTKGEQDAIEKRKVEKGREPEYPRDDEQRAVTDAGRGDRYARGRVEPPRAEPEMGKAEAERVELVPKTDIAKAEEKITDNIEKLPITDQQSVNKELSANLVQARDNAKSEADILEKTDYDRIQYLRQLIKKYGTEPRGRLYQDEIASILGKQFKKVTIEIPDDGKFSIWNSKENLDILLKRAQRLPGGRLKKMPKPEAPAKPTMEAKSVGAAAARKLGIITQSFAEPGKQRLKSFLQTAKQSPKVSKKAKEELGKIDPEYEQQKTTSMEQRVLDEFTKDDTLVKEAEDFVRDPKEDMDTKGAVGVALLEHYRNTNNDTASVSLVEHLDPVLRGAGRFIQAAKLMNRITGNGWIKKMNTYLEKEGVKLPDDVRKQVELDFKLSAKIKDEKARAEALHKNIAKVASYVPFKVGEWLDAYRYTNMLSNPQSHERNIYGNTVQALITRPLSLMANGDFSGAKTYLAKAWKSALSGEALSSTKKSFNSDFSKWAEFLGDPNISMFDAIRREQGPQSKGKRLAWKALTFIPKLLGAQDNFFGSMIETGEMARLVKQGKSSETAQTIARNLSNKYLYREKFGGKRDRSLPFASQALDGLGNFLEKGRIHENPFVKWPMKMVVPFLRTPIRIAQIGAETSPLAWIGPGINAKNIAKAKFGKEFDKLDSNEQIIVQEKIKNRRGLAAVGTMVTLAGVGAALTGNTTWGVPQDKEAKKLFYASGRRPYSFRVGNKWIPMAYLGPWFLAFALPAAARDAFADNPKSVNEDTLTKLGLAAAGIPKIILSQTPIAGVSGLLEALQGKLDVNMASALGFQGSQFIPTSGLLRWVNKIVDPVYRKPVSIKETIAAGIPGLSKDVQSHQDTEGGDAMRPWTDIYIPYTIGLGKEAEEKEFKSKMEILKERMQINKEKREFKRKNK